MLSLDFFFINLENFSYYTAYWVSVYRSIVEPEPVFWGGAGSSSQNFGGSGSGSGSYWFKGWKSLQSLSRPLTDYLDTCHSMSTHENLYKAMSDLYLSLYIYCNICLPNQTLLTRQVQYGRIRTKKLKIFRNFFKILNVNRFFKSFFCWIHNKSYFHMQKTELRYLF